jgi:hypothetical protein
MDEAEKGGRAPAVSGGRRGHAMRVACALGVILGTTPGPSAAQLLSPGPLAERHAELEGIRRCTACHALGKRGIQAERCMSCHEPLASRVERGSGYHATVSPDCAECHKEHLGREFDLLRLDETAFDHGATSYELRLGHRETDCRACHRAAHVVDQDVRTFKGEHGALDHTFLGLTSECSTCHQEESPHAAKLDGRACRDCHDESTWTEAPRFDHGSTAYPLTGLHARVACSGCHASDLDDTMTFGPVAFGSCATCHTDPHAGAMDGPCASCHSARGWSALRNADLAGRFDHTRTNFPLAGAHARAQCVACHRPGTAPSSELLHLSYRPGTARDSYPRPYADNCASCHIDRHAFPEAPGRWAGCVSCHSEDAWAPSGFGLQRHDAESRFPLAGAHAAVPCIACHADPDVGHTRFTLALAGESCESCHLGDSPHDGSYDGFACERCHVVEAFDVVSFDHDALATSAEVECVTCHASDDPHAGQFAGRYCASCHDSDDFAIEAFDHSATRFLLDGAHERIPCSGCHRTEEGPTGSVVRYTPLPSDCTDCHEEEG